METNFLHECFKLKKDYEEQLHFHTHCYPKTRASDPDLHGSALIWVAASGSRRAKMAHKNRKKYRIFMFWSAGRSLLRAEGFSCSLGVLYGGLGKGKL
jgi:hypothetical protein